MGVLEGGLGGESLIRTFSIQNPSVKTWSASMELERY
jgi:hypothetical protein